MKLEGYMDHREDASASLEVQYGPAHRIKIAPDGRMAQILAGATEIMVNSVHGQGIDRLAPGLKVEAVADDGLVEAYSVADARGFSLAMQWHPEWRVTENLDSMRLSRRSSATLAATITRTSVENPMWMSRGKIEISKTGSRR